MPDETTKLEAIIEKAATALNEAVVALESWEESYGDVLAGISTSIQDLSDHLDNRLRSLPKGTKEVRMSMKQAVLLVQVLGNWASKTKAEAQELIAMAETAGDSQSQLGAAIEEFNKHSEKLVEEQGNLTPSIPELDIESPLKDAESEGP